MTAVNPEVAPSRTTGDRMRDAGSSLLRVGGVFIVVLVVMALFAVLTGGIAAAAATVVVACWAHALASRARALQPE